MKHPNQVVRLASLGLCLAGMTFLPACLTSGGGGGGPKYGSHDFGDNDRNRVVAIGDSVVAGGECSDEVPAFPQRIAEMTGLTVINSGVPGETSSRCAARTGGVLDANKPGFLLILTGHNDAIFDRDFDEVIGNLRAMIQAAKNRMTIPIIATLVPIGAPRTFATGPAIAYSAGIRDLAKQEGVPLVDLEKEFGSNEDLQCDGLHPNAAGSTIIAAAFADKLP